MPKSTAAKQADLEKAASRIAVGVLEQVAASRTLSKYLPKGDGPKITVCVVGTTAMRRLNRVYRKKDYPTDVLSFPAPLVFKKGG
ncbi:MAG: rRNA maturation RNAse YbeY, partial [Bdellovibrionota bacterium]